MSEYYEEKYLTFATDSSATEIQDIGQVLFESEEDPEGITEYQSVVVAGIPLFTRTEKCLYKHCKGKLQPHRINPNLAKCDICNMMQRRDSASMTLSAKIVLKGEGVPPNLTLYASGAQLASITQLPPDAITQEDILMASPFCVTHRGSTLTGVYRQ